MTDNGSVALEQDVEKAPPFRPIDKTMQGKPRYAKRGNPIDLPSSPGHIRPADGQDEYPPPVR